MLPIALQSKNFLSYFGLHCQKLIRFTDPIFMKNVVHFVQKIDSWKKGITISSAALSSNFKNKLKLKEAKRKDKIQNTLKKTNEKPKNKEEEKLRI